MKILIFNWRDLSNPQSGGAERLTNEIAKGLVKKGHQVTLFCSKFTGAKEKEIIEGVAIIRRGSPAVRSLFNSVHFQAFWYYLTEARGKFDLIIDEVHGIPFFTNLYGWGVKRLVLVCEVANEIWDAMWPWPYNLFGKLAERLYLFLYRGEKFLAISPSTKRDLRKFGIKEQKITVLPMGINNYRLNPIPEKERTLTLIFVGRLTRTKGLDQAVKALSLIKKEIPEAKLWVVGPGDGEYADEVKNLIRELDLGKAVIFHGFVSEKEKFSLMAKAHFIVVPSLKEGWGLIVPEAGTVGTPAVVYNTQGLRDLVQNEENGFKVENYQQMAETVIKHYSNKEAYEIMCSKAKKQSLKYDWAKTVEVILKVIKESL